MGDLATSTGRILAAYGQGRADRVPVSSARFVAHASRYLDAAMRWGGLS